MELLNFLEPRDEAHRQQIASDFERLLTGNDVSYEDVLISLSGKTEDALLAYIAKSCNMTLVTFDNAGELITDSGVKRAYEQPVDWAFLRHFGWYPLNWQDNTLQVITNTPLCLEAESYLAKHIKSFDIVLANESLLQRVVSLADSTQREYKSSGMFEVERLRALASEAPVVNLVNSLMYRAIDAGASDMHVEPTDDGGRVRIRVDGILQTLDSIPYSLFLPVISRIKILAGMDIAEKRRPQDGKIALHHRDIDVRASALPLNKGESMVLRFLVKGSLQLDLEKLGFERDTINFIDNDLKQTAGVILMTGPTGSGKTTTLYSFLHQLNSSHEKIITLEDPVEYELEGVNQIHVNPEIGFDFAAGLRSVVRQDPDVIMVGEIRDAETARIAMQSSLTGHLVFSTVHTNDAPSAYVRLIDLGVDEFLLNASVIAILAQRLARKLCPHCSLPMANSEDAIERLQLRELAQRFGVETLDLKQAVGCDKCHHTGYAGRVAVVEYLPNNDHIKALHKDTQFTLAARKYMQQQGFRSLKEDGLLKVIRGQTTVEEVVRIAGT